MRLGDRLFDEAFLHADIEFFVRVLKNGADYGFVHRILTFTRVHEGAVSAYAHVMGTGLVESLAMVTQTWTRVSFGGRLRRIRREFIEGLMRGSCFALH